MRKHLVIHSRYALEEGDSLLSDQAEHFAGVKASSCNKPHSAQKRGVQYDVAVYMAEGQGGKYNDRYGGRVGSR